MTWTSVRRQHLVLAGLLAITCLIGGRGISDESAVMLTGDMARYVMNSVFVRDLIADGGATSYEELVRYAEHYYARYPALSLGQHPPIPYLSAVPFFLVLGTTLLAARIAALVWFVAAAWGLYAVATRLFTWQVAAWASALFVSNLMVVRAGQYLLSEMPMTALVLWSVHRLLKYCDSRRPRDFGWFLVLVVASIYAKQLAVLMFPVYVTIVVLSFGWRTLFTRRALVLATAGLVLIAPMAIMTVGLSPTIFDMARRNATRLFSGHNNSSVSSLAAAIVSTHLSLPTLLVTVAGSGLLILRRRREAVIGLVWILSVVGGSAVFAGTTEPARYAFGALPAYALLAGALAGEAHTRPTRALTAALLASTLLWQVWIVRNVYPSGAGGYEEAAEYVLEHNREPAVLYHSYLDTGYFVFFTRKHDEARRQIVLRADKVFGWDTGDREKDRRRVHEQLQRLGVRWVIAESRPTTNEGGYTLYEELAGPRFAERARFPVKSNVGRDLALVVHEYLDARPADLDAQITIDIPLAFRKFEIRLRDLVPVKR